jgi:hypothetical protein
VVGGKTEGVYRTYKVAKLTWDGVVAGFSEKENIGRNRTGLHPVPFLHLTLAQSYPGHVETQLGWWRLYTTETDSLRSWL